MKRLTARPDKDVDKVKLRSAIHGEGAYEAFKRIASEFYKDHTYKFVALTLDGDPRPDSVEFTAEFWSVLSEVATQPPNDPLTLEELREMVGEPVWIVQEEVDDHWAVINAVSTTFMHTYGHDVLETKYCGIDWWAYRRKPEDAPLRQADICTATGRPCCQCNPGPCDSRKPEEGAIWAEER